MRAFEVSLNGETLCVAGIGTDGVLSGIVSWVAGKNGNECFLHVGGLISQTQEHVDWISHRPLEIDDKMELVIRDKDSVDEPGRRSPEDQERNLEGKKNYVRRLAKELGWKIQETPL
jgi:hypothetical protein